MIRAITALILCAAGLAAAAPQDVNARIDAYIQAEMKRLNVPGLSLAVVKDKNPFLVKGYGLANIEHGVAVKPETVFQSGSLGKQFTAAAVMLLVEDGRIVLDEKVGKYLGPVPSAWTGITVRHLLTHTSGAGGYPKGFDFRRDYTEDELLKRILEEPLLFQPGEKFAYSNLGYVTLGILIGKVTGKFYGDFLNERIFTPLGMTTARIISEPDIVPNRAAGYRLVQGVLKNQDWVSPTLNTTADGSLYLTALDMIKWDAALDGPGLFKRSSLDEMWLPVTLKGGGTHPYGFGWMLSRRNDRRIIEHGGAWQGFMSHIARYVDDGLTVIVFVNRGGVPAGVIANGVAAILDPDLAPRAVPDTEPAVTAAHRKLLDDLIAGTAIDRSQFTPQVATDVLPKIEQSRAQVKGLGAIESVEVVERVTKGGMTAHRYRVKFRLATAVYVVAIDAAGKIAGLSLNPE
jgi:CubicO group peptidase (beta-lactamase class C family)